MINFNTISLSILKYRFDNFGVGLRLNQTNELEIRYIGLRLWNDKIFKCTIIFSHVYSRSLTIFDVYWYHSDDLPPIDNRHLLVEIINTGLLDNLTELFIRNDSSHWVPLFKEHLPDNSIRNLTIDETYLQLDLLTDVRPLFNCFKHLTNLQLLVFYVLTCKLDSNMENELRAGFQKLKRLNLSATIEGDGWPLLQRMMT